MLRRVRRFAVKVKFICICVKCIITDIFGLNAARQPDAEAEVDLKLADYRKLDPGPIEEFLFYDHPSGRARIYAAMRWKAEHLRELENAVPHAKP
jgi:STE24 endopeptidase